MQTLIKILSFQPFVAELSIVFVALIAALFLSFWGGRKLFISLAAKSRRAASVAAFIWYILLFFYFSIVIFILPHAILIDLGFSQNDIDRLYFAAGNYPVVFFFIFLIVGAAMLFVSIKKRTARGELVESASIPAPTPVSLARSLWRGTRRAFLIIILVFLALAISRVPAVQEKQRTKEVVNKIHSQKITLADVMGQNLPPEPDPRLKDYTVEGIDANGNGIRDDVELAIFELYPDSARIRAAELQYAMALQNFLISVFNSETLVAVIHKDERASFCMGDAISSPDRTASEEEWNKYFAMTDANEKKIKNLVLNTEIRKQKYDEVFKNYMTSYASSNESTNCDIPISSFAK